MKKFLTIFVIFILSIHLSTFSADDTCDQSPCQYFWLEDADSLGFGLKINDNLKFDKQVIIGPENFMDHSDYEQTYHIKLLPVEGAEEFFAEGYQLLYIKITLEIRNTDYLNFIGYKITSLIAYQETETHDASGTQLFTRKVAEGVIAHPGVQLNKEPECLVDPDQSTLGALVFENS